MVILIILETMIEYRIISSILDKICKMTTKTLEYPRDLTLLDPTKNFARNQNMGNIMEKAN
jgi:hypothetical protein